MVTSLLYFLCLGGALSTATQPRHRDWLKLGKPDGDYHIRVILAVKQTNPRWLQAKLRAVSYPDSPEYGNYMNFDEIAEYVHGRPESVQVVIESFASIGVNRELIDFTLGRDFAIIYLPVEAAERLFSADFYKFQHKEKKGWMIVKSLHYKLPPSLEGHLDFVFGINEFPTGDYNRNLPKKSTTPVQLGVTPDYLSQQYNTSGYVSHNSQNSQAVAGFVGEYFSPENLASFQKKYNLPVKPIVKVVGKNNASVPGLEAELDVQYTSATGRNVDTWFVSTETTFPISDDFLLWIIGQVNTTDSPWVHSVSYGIDEDTVDTYYLSRVESEFMKFGVSGRTVLFSSGDYGVNCYGVQDKFQPHWPASSAYVTAVGGTITPTKVWSDGGGGFSNAFPRPSYQDVAVEAYLKSGKAPPTFYFNTSGRAYPDVSAFSVNFVIEYEGIPTNVSGTSCATPTFAGIVSLLNDVRLQGGKKTLGFLNPLLYQTLMGKGFNDITEGSNSGGEFCDGFNATQGWDPASGWGSPNFGLLKTLVMQ